MKNILYYLCAYTYLCINGELSVLVFNLYTVIIMTYILQYIIELHTYIYIYI